MRYQIALMGITLAVCSTGFAQETGNERVVVPVRNSTHARKLDVNLMGGSIVVKSLCRQGSDRGDERQRW